MIYNEVFDIYWKFAYSRQETFFNRMNGKTMPWSDDPILQKYKFTNVYRVTDRVSQYLIKNVIYNGKRYSDEDTILRILLFKIFNKIETWQLLENHFEEISYKNFDVDKYAQFLNTCLDNHTKIYSAAYIMPSGISYFGDVRKHRNNLLLIDLILRSGIIKKIANCRSLKSLYHLLLEFPTLGPFLAFQFAIDINYSELTDFNEMSFVVAGPGAKRGIEKCFGVTDKKYEYYIHYMADNQQREFERLGLDFKTLFGRPLQLIDCQNIFCELDKYLRVLYPDIITKDRKTRIKQLFKPKSKPLTLFLPPKWGLVY